MAEGRHEEAKALKYSKFILTASVSTLKRKDKEDDRKRYEHLR